MSTDELLKESTDVKDTIMKNSRLLEERRKNFRWCLISLFIGLLFLIINILYFDMNWLGDRAFISYLKYWIIINPVLLHLVTVIPFVLSIIFFINMKRKG